jgi:GH15 family glucan-1,4-alpha-glucosidase
VFLPCSFWLVDVYVQLGRTAEAGRLFEKLLGLRNDLGPLSEEYDPGTARALGHFPQAFSHPYLITSAYNLTNVAERPALHRSGRHGQ